MKTAKINRSLVRLIENVEFLKAKIDFWIVASLFILFSFLYGSLAIIRHEHFQSRGVDFSTYDQALWLYSRFEIPYSTVNNLTDLADRFRPIMIPLSSLYWFTNNERVLLLFQAVILSAAIFPIWLIARKFLPRLLAVIIAFLYIDFVGIQAINVYDFHEMSLLPFFLSWMFYFLIKNKWHFYFIFLLLNFSVREHVGLLLSTLGVYIWFSKRNAKMTILTAIISLIWSISAIKIIMPALGQNGYESFLQEGDSLETVLFEYSTNPVLTINNFFLPVQKTQTLFWSFFSFGLIPIIYFPLIPSILFQFASRFLDMIHPVRWTLFFHYSAELAVLLAISTIFGTKFILGKFRRFKYSVLILSVLLIITHVTTNVVLNSPLKLLLKPDFYKHKIWMDSTRTILRKVPHESSVAAQNNLLPHLSRRKEIYLLPNVNNADYVVLDLHPGQDNWNFYTENLQGAKNMFKEMLVNKSYKPVSSSGDVYILKKTD